MFTVFLADTDAAHRKELAHALRRRGLRAVEFTSGSDLYASVIAGTPDLVLLDVELDEMDGFQLFSRLLRRRADRPLPLVFLTDFMQAHVVEVCLQRGARAYLRKADPAEQVAEAVWDLLTTPDASTPDAGAAAHCLEGGERAPVGAAPGVASPAAKGRGRWAVLAACALVAAIGFAIGAVLAARFPERSSPADAGHGRTATRDAPASAWAGSAVLRFPGSLPAPDQGAPADARPLHRDPPTSPSVQKRTATLAASKSTLRELRTDLVEAGAFPVRRFEVAPRDPATELLRELNLLLPEGAVLDVSGSDLRPASERGGPPEARVPRILTFRVGQALEEVLELYAERGVEFDRRIVRLQAPFPVVDRTVARGRLVLEDGRQATLTVSRPGLDFAARGVFPGTSLRIDIRE